MAAVSVMNFVQLTKIAEEEVAAVRAKMPADIAALAARVAVHFDAAPSPELLAAEGFDDDLLGLFDGAAYGDELTVSDNLPPQIFLYLENIYDYCGGDAGDFRE